MKIQREAIRLLRIGFSALALAATVSAFGQPVITSFSANGVLVCSNLAPGSVGTVEWAPTVAGPWTNNWAGLDAVAVGIDGMVSVSVPMFYRIRGANLVPSGMALIPAGSFTMGDTVDAQANALPLHTVYVSGFYIDTNLVSYAQWLQVYQWATSNAYDFDHAGSGKAANHPVQTLDWYDCVKWCNARSEKEGLVPAYYTSASQTSVYRSGEIDLDNSCVKWSVGYRLPTEAEWERAARGGAAGHRFPWSDVETIDWSRANYYASPSSYSYDVNPSSGYDSNFTSGGQPYTSPAGYFAANGYGLYDMAGNVHAWCWDWYDSGYYNSSPGTDPRGPASSPGGARLRRGGSWGGYAYYLRCATRASTTPSGSDNHFGFRCVRGI
jgi:formylglycine-generating enzyme required for sulfatase activity